MKAMSQFGDDAIVHSKIVTSNAGITPFRLSGNFDDDKSKIYLSIRQCWYMLSNNRYLDAELIINSILFAINKNSVGAEYFSYFYRAFNGQIKYIESAIAIRQGNAVAAISHVKRSFDGLGYTNDFDSATMQRRLLDIRLFDFIKKNSSVSRGLHTKTLLSLLTESMEIREKHINNAHLMISDSSVRHHLLYDDQIIANIALHLYDDNTHSDIANAIFDAFMSCNIYPIQGWCGIDYVTEDDVGIYLLRGIINSIRGFYSIARSDFSLCASWCNIRGNASWITPKIPVQIYHQLPLNIGFL